MRWLTSIFKSRTCCLQIVAGDTSMPESFWLLVTVVVNLSFLVLGAIVVSQLRIRLVQRVELQVGERIYLDHALAIATVLASGDRFVAVKG
jgi:hypothetical protein